MNSDRRNKAIATINDAFGHTTPPSIDRISDHRCAECDELRDFLGGRHWSEISTILGLWDNRYYDGYLGVHRDELCLLSEEAFRHYLPLWAMACVLYPDEIDVGYDSLISNLARAEMNGFTVTELRALDVLMEYLINEAREAGESDDFLSDEMNALAQIRACIARKQDI